LVEAYVSNQVIQIVEALEDDSPIATEIGKRWSEQYAASDVAHRNDLQDQADDIESRVAKLRKDHYVKGVISDYDFEELEADLLGKLAPIEAALALIPEVTHGTGFLADLIQLGGDHSDPLGPDTGWSKLDHHIKRSIIRCVIDNVIVEAGEKGKPGENIEGRCEISTVKPEEAVAAATRPNRVANPAVNRKAKLANA
jgi:chaperonin cofactor prefoldin